jgi:hypothetical protein
MFGIISLALATGTVFSHQFALWPIALAAVAWRDEQDKRISWALLTTVPLAAASGLMFSRYGDLSHGVGLVLVSARSLLVLGAALLAFVGLGAASDSTTSPEPTPSTEAPT